jgi:hypothetical protein
MRVEFTEFERPRRLGSKSSVSGMTMVGDLTFDAKGRGTRVAWD